MQTHAMPASAFPGSPLAGSVSQLFQFWSLLLLLAATCVCKSFIRKYKLMMSCSNVYSMTKQLAL